MLRCPDRETADRVMGTLRKQAERIKDTLVAVPSRSLTSAERAKLRDQGVIIGGAAEGDGSGVFARRSSRAGGKTSKRRRY